MDWETIDDYLCKLAGAKKAWDIHNNLDDLIDYIIPHLGQVICIGLMPQLDDTYHVAITYQMEVEESIRTVIGDGPSGGKALTSACLKGLKGRYPEVEAFYG